MAFIEHWLRSETDPGMPMHPADAGTPGPVSGPLNQSRLSDCGAIAMTGKIPVA